MVITLIPCTSLIALRTALLLVNRPLNNLRWTTKRLVDTGTALLLMGQTIVDTYYAKVKGAVFNDTQGGYTFPSISIAIGNGFAVVPGKYINFAPVDST